MRIGVMLGGAASQIGLAALTARARELEARGFDTFWIPNVFGFDAVTAAAVVGGATQRIEIGTAVVPTQPRHPVALAQQALTAGAACGGRFTLGIGLSHPILVEQMWGLSYARRARHMQEYLGVLGPLLRGERADQDGDEFRVHFELAVPEAKPVPIVLAALGDRMLAIAGRETSGTILWMAGPRTIETHIAPKICAAAREAGRPAPRIIAGMHILLTNDADAAHARIATSIERYRMMPSYRAMLEKEGSESPEALALIGDERRLDAGLARLRAIGVTDFEASVPEASPEEEERTFAYLASRLGSAV